MRIGAPFGIARDSIGLEQDRPGDARGRSQGAVAGAGIIRRGLLRRYLPRDLWVLAAALAGPLAASAVLLPFRLAGRTRTLPCCWLWWWSRSLPPATRLWRGIPAALRARGDGLAGGLPATSRLWRGKKGK